VQRDRLTVAVVEPVAALASGNDTVDLIEAVDDQKDR
jgi:hypothetical protein